MPVVALWKSMVVLWSRCRSSDRTSWDQQGAKVAPCLDAFRQPFYRGLFLYILRPEAGTGDTIDRWRVASVFILKYASEE